jgi:Na+/proline symporter
LLLAAILAATMSTHSGAINALAAASTHDIYLPLTKRSADDPRTLKVGKTFALIWGVVLTGGALLFPDNPQTPVVVIALSIASFTYGALLGAFFLGIFWRRARQRDAILGMSVGIIAMALIVFARQLSGTLTFLQSLASCGPSGTANCIAWPWYVLIGTTITLTVGVISSFIGAPAAPPPPAQSTAKAA